MGYPMDKPAAIAFAVAVGMAAAAQAIAQTAPPTGASVTVPAATSQQHKLFRGSRIIGSNVRDPKDKKIGQIKDLILDGGRGEIAYAVVSFGGVLGVGNKLHAIPWQVLDPSDDGNYYILHADSETISQAPGFDKARWPDMTNQRWHAEIDRYWSRMVGRGHSGNRGISAASPTANPPGESGSGTGSGGSGRSGQ